MISLLRQSIGALLLRACGLLAAATSQIALTRYVGPENLGFSATAVTFAGYCTQLVSLQLDSALTRRFWHARNGRDIYLRSIWARMSIATAIGLPFVFSVSIAMGDMPPWLVVAAYVSTAAPLVANAWVLPAAGKLRLWQLLSLVPPLIVIIATTVAELSTEPFKGIDTLISLLGVVLYAASVSIAAKLVLPRRLLSLLTAVRWMLRVATVEWRLVVSSVLLMVYTSVDFLVLSFKAPVGQLGEYRSGQVLAAAIAGALAVVGASVALSLKRSLEVGASAFDVTLRRFSATALVAAGVAVAVIPQAIEILHPFLFGADYREGVQIAALLCGAKAISIVSIVRIQACLLLKKDRALMIGAAVALVTNVLITSIGHDHLGVAAGALANVSGEAVFASYIYLACLKK